ncbi:hypothetical protein GCM10010329_18770 [Streptomyces spiroverticillatus]|uniref:Uncharacterized protein n=1 Tax=Streptomyces finlayi TaxID=67296 RepID=A0A918WU26_9ACTN|nr:hypothetical protein GCM10010329_18770 [Streptomyces spiroverticillatus]GHC82755.1 hypothetical protein GCM10010334_11250 [Streptomyces finlayi]
MTASNTCRTDLMRHSARVPPPNWSVKPHTSPPVEGVEGVQAAGVGPLDGTGDLARGEAEDVEGTDLDADRAEGGAGAVGPGKSAWFQLVHGPQRA